MKKLLLAAVILSTPAFAAKPLSSDAKGLSGFEMCYNNMGGFGERFPFLNPPRMPCHAQ